MESVKREYVAMSNETYDKIESGIRESYPNSCVLWIEKVTNSWLDEHFEAQRTLIETKRQKPCQVWQLYHGTKEEAINSIINHGFNVSSNVRNAYGIGTYFAKNANYSKDYAAPAPSDQVSFMLLCDVLIGEIATGYGSGKAIDVEKHDNSVDNIKKPGIIVTPYDYGAIPRYIIAFYRNAK